MAVTHWAPEQYRPTTERGRQSNYSSIDVHLAVLTSILHHNPGITRQDMAQRFRRVIERHNAGGWGRQWVLTEAQYRDLVSGAVFETAWRAIDPETVSAYGV
jgi:hypothetical protein